MTRLTQVYCLPIFWKEPGRMRGWIQKYLRVSEIHFRPALLGQTQNRPARIFSRLEIKFIFNNKSYVTAISRDISTIAIIHC